MLIREADARRTETPGGIMTTLASPTQGAAGLSIWRVEGNAGVAGPVHTISADQVWTFLEGAVSVRLGEEELAVVAGDTVVMPAGAVRQVTAGEAGFVAICTAPAEARAAVDGKDFGIPAWIA
ncbi:MAG: cupin [Thermoactinospora sp.]|nr:cupin [Thermoactinospora sp.]